MFSFDLQPGRTSPVIGRQGAGGWLSASPTPGSTGGDHSAAPSDARSAFPKRTFTPVFTPRPPSSPRGRRFFDSVGIFAAASGAGGPTAPRKLPGGGRRLRPRRSARAAGSMSPMAVVARYQRPVAWKATSSHRRSPSYRFASGMTDRVPIKLSHRGDTPGPGAYDVAAVTVTHKKAPGVDFGSGPPRETWADADGSGSGSGSAVSSGRSRRKGGAAMSAGVDSLAFRPRPQLKPKSVYVSFGRQLARQPFVEEDVTSHAPGPSSYNPGRSDKLLGKRGTSYTFSRLPRWGERHVMYVRPARRKVDFVALNKAAGAAAKKRGELIRQRSMRAKQRLRATAKKRAALDALRASRRMQRAMHSMSSVARRMKKEWLRLLTVGLFVRRLRQRVAMTKAAHAMQQMQRAEKHVLAKRFAAWYRYYKRKRMAWAASVLRRCWLSFSINRRVKAKRHAVATIATFLRSAKLQNSTVTSMRWYRKLVIRIQRFVRAMLARVHAQVIALHMQFRRTLTRLRVQYVERQRGRIQLMPTPPAASPSAGAASAPSTPSAAVAAAAGAASSASRRLSRSPRRGGSRRRSSAFRRRRSGRQVDLAIQLAQFRAEAMAEWPDVPVDVALPLLHARLRVRRQAFAQQLADYRQRCKDAAAAREIAEGVRGIVGHAGAVSAADEADDERPPLFHLLLKEEEMEALVREAIAFVRADEAPALVLPRVSE
eukprot:PLAT223.3.p1 GENE.PLAT223.3~~PLAT223.3.p1  ORF type:complete len:712 (-),score=272.12 PLAT223.3:54-2189(-)